MLFLLQYFLAADEDNQNMVVVRVLQILTVLIKYGYYDATSDINALLPSIHKLLDGKEDYPSKKIKDFVDVSLGVEIQRREYLNTSRYHGVVHCCVST